MPPKLTPTPRIRTILAALVAVVALSWALPGAPPVPPLAGGAPGPAHLLSPELASAQVSKSREGGEGGGASGNISRVGDRTGKLISGWAVPVMLALAGIFILGALARREVGAAIAVVLITIAASFFLLTPDAARAAIEGISRFILG